MFFMFDLKDALHQEPDQVSRQKSALRLNVESINSDEKTGIINGYNVSLDSCACRDWFVRHKPCKHMYRLAHELGIFQLQGTIADAKKSETDIRTERKRLKEKALALPDDARLFLYDITRAACKVQRTQDIDDIIKLLLSQELIAIRQPTEKELYAKCTVARMRKAAPDAPKSLKKNELIAYLRDHVPEFEKELIDDFNNNFYMVDWPDQYKKSRVAVQRAITPYKGLNDEHIVTISIDLTKAGTSKAVEIKRIK